MPEKNAPLTVEEITEAADIFFPLYEVVTSRLPDASVEDALKIMENLASLAQKERAKKREKEVKEKFGFNKQKEDTKDA